MIGFKEKKFGSREDYRQKKAENQNEANKLCKQCGRRRDRHTFAEVQLCRQAELGNSGEMAGTRSHF